MKRILKRIRRYIVIFVRKTNTDILLFRIKKKDNYISAGKAEIENAREALKNYQEDPNTSCITENNIKKGYDLHIIIPAYNCEKYLENCLKTIFAMKTKYSFFVTVVDDGSTDATADIMKKYECRDNFEAIYQKNGGAAMARNAALKNIYASYIMFMDADDEISQSAAEKLLDKATADNCDIVEGNYCYTDENGEKLFKDTASVNIPRAFGFFRGFPPGKVIKAELFKNICFPEKYWFEDSVMAPVIYAQAKNAARIKDIVYYYRKNPTGSTAKVKGNRKAVDSFYITKKLCKERDKLNIKKDQDYYEHILRQIKLTYARTAALEEEIKKNIFILWYDFLTTEFSDFGTSVFKMRFLEKAVRDKNYGAYQACCKYL